MDRLRFVTLGGYRTLSLHFAGLLLARSSPIAAYLFQEKSSPADKNLLPIPIASYLAHAKIRLVLDSLSLSFTKGKTMSTTIARLQSKLSSARSKSQGKPVANNTRLFERDNGSIAVQLHSTDVVTYHADDSCTLDSGGWQTVTTKERMNCYAPGRVYSDKGIWYVSYAGKQYLYADGMTLHNDGTVTGAKEYDKELEKLAQKNRTRIKAYAKKFVDALYAGKIPAPSGGDCWHCCMKTVDEGKPLGEVFKDKDHIESHLAEKYYVPSLLYNSLEAFGASQVERHIVWVLTHPGEDKTKLWPGAEDRNGHFAKHIEKYVSKYVMRQLGMAS